MKRRLFILGAPAVVLSAGCEPGYIHPDRLLYKTTSERATSYSPTIRASLEALGEVIAGARPDKIKDINDALDEVRQLDRKVQTQHSDQLEDWTRYLTLASGIIDLVVLVPDFESYVTASRMLLLAIESIRVSHYGVLRPLTGKPRDPEVVAPDGKFPPGAVTLSQREHEKVIGILHKDSVVLAGNEAHLKLKRLLLRRMKD